MSLLHVLIKWYTCICIYCLCCKSCTNLNSNNTCLSKSIPLKPLCLSSTYGCHFYLIFIQCLINNYYFRIYLTVFRFMCTFFNIAFIIKQLIKCSISLLMFKSLNSIYNIHSIDLKQCRKTKKQFDDTK